MAQAGAPQSVTNLQAEIAQAKERRQRRGFLDVKKALENGNLAICVGAGVTVFSTASASGQPLEQMLWKGLIRNGLGYLVDSQRMNTEDLPKDIKRAYEDVESERARDMIQAATTLKGGLSDVGEFPTWLDGVFRDLEQEVRHPEMLNALRNLHEHGAMLLTTNYDGLLEHACNVQAAHADDRQSLFGLQLKRTKAIFHPHGYYERAGTVVLDAFNYYDITKEDHAVRELLKYFLQYHTILFVGCDKGLRDPNFGPLLEWIGKKQSDLNIPHQHYILLRNADSAVAGPLIGLFYGENYEDMAPWLEKLMDSDTAAPDGTLSDIPVDSDRRKIHEWLSPPDQKSFYCDMLDMHQPDTGVWFLRGFEFKRWRLEKSTFMWLHGSEHCGKTVLCSSAINAIQRASLPATPGRSRDSVAYFYCEPQAREQRKGRADTHVFREFLEAVISQLCPPNSTFQPLYSLYRDCTRRYPGRPPTSAQLQDTLLAILSQLNSNSEAPRVMQADLRVRVILPGETYLFIDALDKVPSRERDKFLNLLFRMESLRMEHLHVMITSRDVPSIRALLGVSPKWERLKCDENSITDIRSYLLGIFRDNRELSLLSDDTKTRVVDEILIKIAQPSYQFAIQYIETLLHLNPINTTTVLGAAGLQPRDRSVQVVKSRSKSAQLAIEAAQATPSEGTDLSAQLADQWLDRYDMMLENWIYPLVDDASTNAKVRITLLSTGVDMSDPEIQALKEGIVALESFVPQPAFQDDLGFGTHAASLLLRLAPGAELSIAKVCSLESYPNAEIVAKALHMAMADWNPDIIALPFRFADRSPILDQAMTIARASNILVLCPAQEHQFFNKNFAYSIKIGSVNGHGKLSPWAAKDDGSKYGLLVLGQEVESSWPRSKSGQTRTKRLSGNATATIVAAGTAAVLLFYAQCIMLDHRGGDLTMQSWHKKFDLLTLMRTRTSKNDGVLVPWDLFSPDSHTSEDIERVNTMIRRVLSPRL